MAPSSPSSSSSQQAPPSTPCAQQQPWRCLSSPWRAAAHPPLSPMACCSSRSPSSLCPLPQEQQLLLPWSASLLPLGSFLQAELLCQERLLHLTAAPFFSLALLSRLLAARARRLCSFSLPHKTASAQELLLHGRPEFQQRAPFLAVRRGARRLFGKMRSKPRTAAASSLALRCVELRYCTSPIENSSPSASRARLAALARVVSQ
ncbi:uncharacterized protein [Zea mays]|uniref:Uncharacterized protein n=1 Tax=Zea mays TaxID=4577 RepID=C0P965_MAIZE|nr:uncharacterized protein LOC118476394 [Zea mays]ACN30710.1 unknown [Zea mays]|eukprot:NP_001168789.1 uncharacterized protein LOC100382588 [Zea mays]